MFLAVRSKKGWAACEVIEACIIIVPRGTSIQYLPATRKGKPPVRGFYEDPDK
jgi:hypothetical protein